MMQMAPGEWLPTTTMSVLDAAALYIEHLMRVVILHGIKDDGSCTCGSTTCKPGKHPASNAWQKKVYATVDEFRDALAGKRIPEPANLGIVLGKQLDERYLIAIDADDLARLAELESILCTLPETLTSRSGGGGSHRLYALGPGQDAKRMKNRGGLRLTTEPPTPGVDVKVAGGQIVACPSAHVSGERYSWAVSAPIAELPARWYDVIADPVETAKPRTPSLGPNVIQFGERYTESVIENNCKDIASRGKGERNQVLWTKSCTVLEHCAGAGASFSRAIPRLRDAGIACGLPRAEVDDVLRKVERHVRSTGKTRMAPNPSPPSQRGSGTHAVAAAYEPGAEEAATGEREVAEPSFEPEINGWRDHLSIAASGIVKNTFGNVCKILRHDEAFAGRLSYNRMRIAPFIDGRPLEDADIAQLREQIERLWAFSPANESVIQAVMLIASESSFHPLQDYLHGLQWDGEKRIERVAREVLGVMAPDPLTQRMLRCWFISAVARALRPGCKVDTTIVLVGDQGHRKSTFFATLGGEWFSDTYVDIRNKDGILQIHAAWIHEWAEIERVTIKTSSSDVKAFLTSARDSVRPPFGRGVLIQPRSSVIVGTTNKSFIDDETGSRRFWPIQVNRRVAVDILAGWRDQLWAEAVQAFASGEVWWLTAEEDRIRETASDEHMLENPWLEKVGYFLSSPARRLSGVTVADVLTDCLKVDVSRAHLEAGRVGKTLKRCGWVFRWMTRNGVRVRVYFAASDVLARDDRDPGSETADPVRDLESENTGSDRDDRDDHPTHMCIENSGSAVVEGAHVHTHAHEHARGALRNDPDPRDHPVQGSINTGWKNPCHTDPDHLSEPGFGDWLADEGIISGDGGKNEA